VAVFSLNELLQKQKAYNEGKNAYSELEQFADIYVPGQTPSSGDGSDQQDGDQNGNISIGDPEEVRADLYRQLQNIGADFDALSAINDEVVGWIQISNTKINYPVAQGSDNSYYLRHMFNKEYNAGGAIFLDYRNSSDFSSRHSIMYGHQMGNGTMFTGIQNYKNQSYYDSHAYGILYTPSGNYVVEFFSGYVTANSGDAWDIRFNDDEEFSSWIESQISKSDFSAGFTPSVSDMILTFSTCSSAFENAKYVLHGVIRNSG
jgi:sortase B